MPFIFELWFFFYVILPTLVVLTGVGTYKAAPQEISDLVKRAALIARSNLGHKKSKATLVKEQMALNPYTGPDDDKKALAVWQAQFSGAELVLVDKNRHTIARSWNELNDNYHDGVTERWYWECTCGEKEYRKTSEAAKNAARRHIQTFDGRDENGVRSVGWLKKV